MKNEDIFCTWSLVVARTFLPAQPGQSVWGKSFLGSWTQSCFQAGSLVLEGSCLRETPWPPMLVTGKRSFKDHGNKRVFIFPGVIVVLSREGQGKMSLCHHIWTRIPLYSFLC